MAHAHKLTNRYNVWAELLANLLILPCFDIGPSLVAPKIRKSVTIRTNSNFHIPTNQTNINSEGGLKINNLAIRRRHSNQRALN